jgi:hypothetical protein
MWQKGFSSLGYDIHHKTMRRQRFLAEMIAVVTCASLFALIEPDYP